MKAAGVLLVTGALACSRAPADDRRNPEPPSSARVTAPSVPAKAPSPSVETTPHTPDTTPPLERSLERASIVSLASRPGAALGVLDAAVRLPGATHTVPARLTLALIDDPLALRRPLAFHRLAHALGARVVPVSVLRREGAGFIAELLAPDLLAALKPRLAVQNDGTVDALLTSAGPAGAPFTEPHGHSIAVNGSAEMEALARGANSAVPLPGENPRLLRDFIEMRVLDYLSANVLRRTVFLDDAGSLVLDDNATAFPLHVDPRAEVRLLNALRSSARFPKNLRAALDALDRSSAAARFAPGSFEEWLISPRNLVALDERRVSLLSLLDAKIAASGGAAVQSL